MLTLQSPSRRPLARLTACVLLLALLVSLMPAELHASWTGPSLPPVADDRIPSPGRGACDHDGPLFFGITWDLENRLVKVTKADGTVVDHVYDADGVRVQTTTTLSGQPPQVTNYLVDTSASLSHVVAETDASGTLKAYYVHGDDLLAVMRPLVPAPATAADWQTRYVHPDGIGSIRRLTDENGAITDGYTYSAFGELLAHTGQDPQPYAFAGEPYDPNVGFQYHRARWMDPRVGRFVGMDPFRGRSDDPVSLHRFLYAAADPISKRDPTGRFIEFSFSVSISNILNAMATITMGAVLGGIDGGIRAQLNNEDWVIGALKGAQVGMLFGPLARWKAAQPYLISIGTALAGSNALAAYMDENTGLALYDGILFVAGSSAVVIQMMQTSAATGPVLVYRTRPDPRTGEVAYVGITQNFSARATTHLRTKGIEVEEIGNLNNLTRDDARAVEQVLIEFYGLSKDGGTLLNKINSISRTDPGYAASLTRGSELLRGAGYPGF